MMANETENAGKRGGKSFRDEPLSALLQGWQVDAPQQDFEAAFWRRIATPSPKEGWIVDPFGFLRDLGAQPGWTSALATAAAVAVGLWFGFSVPRMRDHQPAPRMILGERTAAGAYLSMAAGDVR